VGQPLRREDRAAGARTGRQARPLHGRSRGDDQPLTGPPAREAAPATGVTGAAA